MSVAEVDCLRTRTKGTIAAVYPEGVGYAGITPGREERLVTILHQPRTVGPR